jgi:hypothetical protein
VSELTSGAFLAHHQRISPWALAQGKISFLRPIDLAIRSHVLETNPPSRKPILIWLIVSQLLAVASLFFWLVMAGLSVMAFDSGVTQEAWNFVIVVWLYPVWPILFAIAAWIAYARKKDKLAGVLTTLTFLPILVLMLIIAGANFFV